MLNDKWFKTLSAERKGLLAPTILRSTLLVIHSIRYAHKMVTRSHYPSLNPARDPPKRDRNNYHHI